MWELVDGTPGYIYENEHSFVYRNPESGVKSTRDSLKTQKSGSPGVTNKTRREFKGEVYSVNLRVRVRGHIVYEGVRG